MNQSISPKDDQDETKQKETRINNQHILRILTNTHTQTYTLISIPKIFFLNEKPN